MKLSTRAIGFKVVAAHDLPLEFERCDPRVQTLAFLAAGISLAVFELPLILTHIERTAEEQHELYGAQESRGLRVPISPHQAIPSRAIDCRVLHAPDPELYGRTLERELNARVVYMLGDQHHVALYEGAPRTPHLHLQVPATDENKRKLLSHN